MEINVLVVDDCKNDIKMIETSVKVANAAPELIDVDFKIESFFNPKEALKSSKNPHIAILDINMPVMSGFDLVVEINKKYPRCKIIFVSDNAEFAADGYKFRAHGFVIKPFKQQKFTDYMVSATEGFRSLGAIPVKGIFTKSWLKYEDVLYLQTSGKESDVYSISGEGFECKYSLKKLMNEWLLKWLFFRTSRNTIINLDHYNGTTIDKKTVILKHGSIEKRVGISKDNYQKLEDAITLYYRTRGRR